MNIRKAIFTQIIIETNHPTFVKAIYHVSQNKQLSSSFIVKSQIKSQVAYMYQTAQFSFLLSSPTDSIHGHDFKKYHKTSFNKGQGLVRKTQATPKHLTTMD